MFTYEIRDPKQVNRVKKHIFPLLVRNSKKREQS